MSKFFSKDPAGAVRNLYDTEQEALEDAAYNLEEYRRDAREDGEWSREASDICVGVATTLPGVELHDDYDVVTHRATFVGNEDEGYEVEIRPVGSATEPDARVPA